MIKTIAIVGLIVVALFVTSQALPLGQIPGCPSECVIKDGEICGYEWDIKWINNYNGWTNWAGGYSFTCPVDNWQDFDPDRTGDTWIGGKCRVWIYDLDWNRIQTCDPMYVGDECKRGSGEYYVLSVVWEKITKECCNPDCYEPEPSCTSPDCYYENTCYPHASTIKKYCDGAISKTVVCLSGVVQVGTNDCNDYEWSKYCNPETGLCESYDICGNGVCEPGLGECSWCPTDCTEAECQPYSCGNGYCDWGETSESCPADCGPYTCYVKGSGCGVGFPHQCCPELECDYRNIVAGVCIDPTDPIKCQPIDTPCGFLFGNCCEGLKCENEICIKRQPQDWLWENIGWIAPVVIFGLVLAIKRDILQAIILAAIVGLIIWAMSNIWLLLIVSIITGVLIWFLTPFRKMVMK